MIRDFVVGLAESPRLAAGVSVATTSTGVGSIMDWIPGTPGEVAVIVGIVLSTVMIISQILRSIREARKSRLEREKLTLEIAKLLKSGERGEGT